MIMALIKLDGPGMNAGEILAQAKAEIAEITGNSLSTYQLAHAEKGPGRLMWEFWASQVWEMVKVPEFTRADWREWKAQPIKDGSTKINGVKYEELWRKWPDLAEHIDAAIAGKE